MRVLLVKTSSLGDVIHNLPVVTDIAKHFPGATVDWVVEEGFVDIPRLHPFVRQVFPIAVRRWRGQLLSPTAWGEMTAFRRDIRSAAYDFVIDTQGLLKSAVVAWQALGIRCGFDGPSAREPWASRLYEHSFPVKKALHAVERNRMLVAQSLGYAATGPADYGLHAIFKDSPMMSGGAFAILLTATSRDDKLWSEDRWVALGHCLNEQGVACVLPAGSERERERAQRIAEHVPGASVMPPSGLRDLALHISAARLVIGVDTGLVHLAAALGRPCVALFSASDPTLTGVLAGPRAVNLGRRGEPPAWEEVWQKVEPWL